MVDFLGVGTDRVLGWKWGMRGEIHCVYEREEER